MLKVCDFSLRLNAIAWVCLCFFVLIPFSLVNSAAAQSGFTGQAAANEVTEFEGTLKASRGNLVTVTREDGVDCVVQFPDEMNSLNFVAKALPAYLRRGMPIRFTTTLGPTGQPLTPIDRIEIFAPVPPNMLSHSQREKYMPGIHYVDRNQKTPRNGVMVGKVYVVGNLMMVSPQGMLAMQAGSTPVQTPVAPDATLELRINNLSLAQPGDTVKVAGFYQPPDDTKVKAETITIRTDRVYGEAPPPKERRTRRSKRDALAEENASEAKSEEAESDKAMQEGKNGEKENEPNAEVEN